MSKPLDQTLDSTFHMSADDTPVVLSSEERASISASKAAATLGEFATDEEVRAVWAKHGLS